jgi:hypothetical protein
MAIKFGDVAGKAKKGAASYAFKDGENVIRIFGEVVPRYVYWLKGKNGKDIPMECLSFDREKEKFTNAERDWVRHYFPELKCSWAYVVQGYSLADKKPVVINLKKKLFEQILSAAEDLGDPTDADSGWDVVFKRQKTGALAFNVEYTLQVLRCKKRALTDEEREAVAAAQPIDELVPRMTADEQKKFIEEQILGQESGSGDLPPEAQEAQESLEDLPY